MSRIGGSAFSILALLTAGCVVTTLEGPGDAPRVTPPPPGSRTGPAQSSFGETFAEAPASTTPEEISARHILVQYRGSLRAPPSITRTKDDARVRAQEALARAQAGEDFAALVAEYSDEPGAAARGGNLGRFKRQVMDPTFSDAAFRLEPGDLSDVVETPFGFHIIQRTE